MAGESTGRSVAIVTGAGGALGRATSLRLAADGFAVAVLGRAGETLDGTAQALRDAGHEPFVLEVDLREPASIVEAIERTEREFGPVDALINNAAIYPSTALFDVTVEEYDDVIAVNQRGYFVAAQAAARFMVRRGRGAIVNVGSITFTGQWERLVSYVSTKGAAVGLTRALARELGPHNVRVNAVAPGAFPTKAEEIHPNPEQYSQHVIDHQSLKRRGADEELAAVISFLVGPDSSFVTGQTVNVDGGWNMQ